MYDLKHFRFWCQSVLPLVYDDSLSYYEVLCKVVDYINHLIDTDNQIITDLDAVKQELEIIQKWIDDFDPEYVEKLIGEHIMTGVFFGLTMDGYFVAYIPESWDDITFGTTQYDTFITGFTEYGHLTLSY